MSASRSRAWTRASTILAATLAGTVVAVVAALLRGTRTESQPLSASAADGQEQVTGTGSNPGWGRRLRAFGSVAWPLPTVAAAIQAPIPHGGFVTRILIVAGVQLILVGLLRHTTRARWVSITLGCYLAVLWLGSALALFDQLTDRVIFFDDQTAVDPVAILVLVMVGILVLCIPATLLVAQAETRRITEPVLYAAIAIIIGGLCLPAIHTLTRTVGTVSGDDSVTLYVASTSKRFTLKSQLILPEIGSVQYGGKTIEGIEISDTGRKPFRWALVLRGGARMTDLDRDSASHAISLTEPEFLGRVQLITGESTDGFSSLQGETVSTFTSDTISRRMVALPSFQAGGVISADGQGPLSKGIGDALAGTGTQAAVTVSVDTGLLEPQESVNSVSPALSDPGSLRWQALTGLRPSFTLVDNDRADVTQDVLFTIAVLLGVSGSALLMAIQSALSYLGSRTTSQ